MLMNDKQREIIDKLNKDNEALNQGHNSMVEYSKGMICIGSLIVCFLIYYFTKYTFQFGFWTFEVYNLVYAKNDKKKIGIGLLIYAFGFSRLSTKYETTKPPAMRVVSKNVIQNNHHSFYNEGVQAIKIRKNGDYNG